MKRIVILTSVLLLIFASCTKEEIGQDAVLKWKGEYEVDGCGFFIELKGETYKPNNEDEIGEEFKKNPLSNVVIDYKLLNKDTEYNCGDLPEIQKEKTIDIISIRMK